MKKGLAMLVMVLSLFLVKGEVKAASLNVFEVTVNQPTSQIDPQQTYLNLELTPSANEVITIDLKNTTEQPLKLHSSFNRAITNSQGVVEYSGKYTDTLEALGTDIEDLVHFDGGEIQLAPNEARTITAEIIMPEENFSGVLAGGFYFEQIPDGQATTGIQNIFSRETALLLRNNQETVVPNLEILAAKPKTENGRNQIELTLENTSGTYLHNLQIDHEVVVNTEQFLTGSKQGMSVAPYSQFNYSLPLDGVEFKNGDYTVHLIATANENSWEASPTFTVNRETAKQLNNSDVMIEETQIPWWLFLIGGIILLQLVVIVVLLSKKRKKKF